jgi:site-specific recombinase XerD
MSNKNSFAVLSFLRKQGFKDIGNSTVYIRITADGSRTEVSTKITVSQSKWDPNKGRVKGTNDESKRLNSGIITFEHRIREIYNRFIEQGKIVTADSIKNELLGSDHKKRLLLQQFKLAVYDMEVRQAAGYAKGTVKNWKVTQGHLQEFLNDHLHVKDIAFHQLELDFIVEFERFARSKWSCGNNAALKHIERIRKVVKTAVVNKWLIKDPFMGFKAKQEKSNRTFLTNDELSAIQTKELHVERLERIRDIFVFCCYTGLAHVDVANLTIGNIVVGIDGKKWIYTFRQKTNIKSNIPLLPVALEILKKYQPENATADSRVLPVITNIKTNAYLKEIATLCGISKNLTFHMARHTFATIVTLTNGVPLETVSRMLGHTKITTTQIYAKVLESKVSEDMNELEEKLCRRNN